MGFRCGIVGLPNVGKSTIFNALTAAGAEASNYPFCTIEPNTGVVPVPDERLHVLAEMAKSQKIIPTTIEFVDIAGLVKGAAQGEGLGNQFLGHIRSVDAIVQVVRCFEDENITHVHGGVSPMRDIEIIETELLLADLASVDKRLLRASKGSKSGDKELLKEAALLERLKGELERGVALRTLDDPDGEITQLQLLTSKPMIFVANVAENDAALEPSLDHQGYVGEVARYAEQHGYEVVLLSGRVESEISQLAPTERPDFLAELGLKTSGLERLSLSGYRLLKLITFFTVGPKEAHAWTCKRGSLAPEAAGKIHTDFEKGFIRAEVISYSDFVESGGEVGAREHGLMRVEGKNYVVEDGDIVHFRFNV